ncbi:hypothetical protein PQR71_01655 [Paraburkholderia fungorum]|jgi:hypothetical protein|uniref:hypothetical protein n=1 Tax=Paraburkholderia fungorum TaxID=134537 RepID=UPI0038B98C07
MVTTTVRRAFSGLTSAFSPGPKGKQGVAYTVKLAQQRADEALETHDWTESTVPYSVKIRKRDFRKPEARPSLPSELAVIKAGDEL